MMPSLDGFSDYVLVIAQRTTDPERRQAFLTELDALAAGTPLTSAFGLPSGFPPAVYRVGRQRAQECWGAAPQDH